MATITKTPLKSATIQGAVITMAAIVASKLLGLHVPTDTAKLVVDVLGDIPADWAMIATAFVGVWTRLLKFDFDKSKLQSKTFWMALMTAIFGVLNVLGVDTAAITDASSTLYAVAAKYLPAAASVWMLVGAWKAKTEIEPHR